MFQAQRSFTRFMLAACTALLLSACAEQKKAEVTPAICQGRSSSAIGGPFSLTDQNGRTVTEADFSNGPSLFYFGFTYCPDVCPLALTKLKLVMDKLGPDAARAKLAFVTVDPTRDTPEALKAYLENPAFPKGVIGLTGSEEEIKKTLQTFKVAAQVTFDAERKNVLEVSHASIIYLMDTIPADDTPKAGKKWGVATFFPDSAPVDDIATCLSSAINNRP